MNYKKRNERETNWQAPATYQGVIGKKDDRGIILTPVEVVKADGSKKPFRKDNHAWITPKFNDPLDGLDEGTEVEFVAEQYAYQKLGGKWNKSLGRIADVRIL